MVGCWERSPLGPFADVMWATPDGRRRLLVPSGGAGAFVSAVHPFDRVDVVPFSAELAGVELDVTGGGRDLGPLRPRWMAAGFGFSEPPRRAAMVRVRPLLADPSGRLDAVLP